MHADRYSFTRISSSLVELATERRASGAIFSHLKPEALLIAGECCPALLGAVSQSFAPVVLARRADKVVLTADMSVQELFDRAAASPSGIAWGEFFWDRSVTTATFETETRYRRRNPFFRPLSNLEAGVMAVSGHEHYAKLRAICDSFKVPVPTAEIWGEPLSREPRLALCA